MRRALLLTVVSVGLLAGVLWLRTTDGARVDRSEPSVALRSAADGLPSEVAELPSPAALPELDAPSAELFAELEQRYRIEVRWDVGEGFFHSSGRAIMRAEPMAEQELLRMPRLLKEALAPYPEDLIAAEVRRICLAGELTVRGHSYGGTYDHGSIFLCNQGEEEGFDDLYLVGAFHHELSSILFYSHDFSADRWRAENPEGFEYDSEEGGGIQAIANGEADLTGDPQYYVQGLLAQYSLAELEEDYNLFCEVMMADPARLKRLASQYPRIAAKAALCREFYESLGIEVP